MGNLGGRADLRVKIMSLSLRGVEIPRTFRDKRLSTGGPPLGVWRRREREGVVI